MLANTPPATNTNNPSKIRIFHFFFTGSPYPRPVSDGMTLALVPFKEIRPVPTAHAQPARFVRQESTVRPAATKQPADAGTLGYPYIYISGRETRETTRGWRAARPNGEWRQSGGQRSGKSLVRGAGDLAACQFHPAQRAPTRPQKGTPVTPADESNRGRFRLRLNAAASRWKPPGET